MVGSNTRHIIVIKSQRADLVRFFYVIKEVVTMALLAFSKNTQCYIFCETESVDNQVETSNHPTETGVPLSDTVHSNPVVLNLSGKIVNTDKATATAIITKIKTWQKGGRTLTYSGQAGVFENMQVQSFTTDYNNKNYGGADFDMTLKEIRIAKTAYVKPLSTPSKEKTVVSKPKGISVGDTVIFTGGKVYVSSDAKKAAATRGQSTCKVTKIATQSWAIHKYHLKSTDGRLVFGWVDAACIKTEGAYAKAYSNGGTQQTQSASNNVIYHKVKSGDTVLKLVNTTYKKYNLSVTEVINANPQAFSVKGKATTLIVGAKLKLTIK